MPTLTEQAHTAALAQVTPQAFTVGGTFDGTRLTGGVTYARTWANGWGATAYIRAWYEDAPVTVSAGVAITKRF